jgi:hypothetical protein
MRGFFWYKAALYRLNGMLWAPFLATSLRGALATKQSGPFLLLLDCFASLAMTWRDQASAAGSSTAVEGDEGEQK